MSDADIVRIFIEMDDDWHEQIAKPIAGTKPAARDRIPLISQPLSVSAIVDKIERMAVVIDNERQ